MSEEQNAGQSVAPTGETNELDTLQKQLADARNQIERLKGTQASNDRALQALREEKQTLHSQLEQFQKDVSARDDDLANTMSALEELKGRASGFDALQQQLDASKAEAERMRLAASYAAKNPALGVLIENNALPQAATVEEFAQALETIGKGLGGVIDTTTNQRLSGAKVVPQVAGEDADALEDRGYELLLSQKGEEGLELIRKAQALRANNQ